MADDQSEYRKKMEEDLKLWSRRYLASSIRFTPAQHQALSHPPTGYNLGVPADIAVRLPDNPEPGGAQWIPRDALLYAEEQSARGADGAEPLPGLHSAAPPIAQILTDARTRPVYWVDHGDGFPNGLASQTNSTTQQTLETTSGSQVAFTTTQPADFQSSLPIRVAQNGTEYSLDALGWTFATQQPARNIHTQVSEEDHWLPQDYPINYTFSSGQPQSQPDDTLSMSTGFQYTANESDWTPTNQHFNAPQQPHTPPGQMQKSFTRASPGAQIPYGLANSLPTDIGSHRGREVFSSSRSAPPALGLEEENDSEPENVSPTPAPRRERTKLRSSKGSSRGTKKTAKRVTKSRQTSAKTPNTQNPSTSTRTKRYNDFVNKRQEDLDNGTADQVADKVQEALKGIAPLVPSGPVPRTRAELTNFLQSFWSRGGLSAAMAPPVATWEELSGGADRSTEVANWIDGTGHAAASMDEDEYYYDDEDDFGDGEALDDGYSAEANEDTPEEFVDEDNYK